MWPRWISVSIWLALFEGLASGQSCMEASFPNSSSVSSFLDGSARGGTEHLRYVARIFELMSQTEANCSADGRSSRMTFTPIPYRVFADGVQSELFEQQEAFSVSNAQVLTNLMIAAAPTQKTASATKQEYCYEESQTGQCTDCNSWQNDLFFNSHLKAAIDSNTDVTAAGVCIKTGSGSNLDCREATGHGAGNVSYSRRSSLSPTSTCDEPWLWQKPMEIFSQTLTNGGFNTSRETSVLPPNFQQATTVHYVDGSTSAWTTVLSQCHNNGTHEWVHINTVPIIANCTLRLQTAGLCSNVDSMAIIGSSYVAFSLRNAYNISQCPGPGRTTKQRDVFVGSAVCSQASLTNNMSVSLTCVNMNTGFQSNSYTCSCPSTSHLVESNEAITMRLANGRISYRGEYLAMRSTRAVQPLTISKCESCQPGCKTCVDGSECLRKNNVSLRVPILVLSIIVLLLVFGLALYVQQQLHTTILQSAAPTYLLAVLASGIMGSLEQFILFPQLNNTTCALQPWPRHIAFIAMFGSMFGKVWRVQVLARLPPGRIQVRTLDAGVQRFILGLTAAFVLYLIIWTGVGRPVVEIIYDGSGQSYEACTVDGWRYTIHAIEFALLLAACVITKLTRSLVFEWTEFKFLLGAFINAAVIKGVIAILYFTLLPNKYSDYLYLLQFFDNFFTINLSLIILFGHKIYMIQRSKGDRSIGPTVPSQMSRLSRQGSTSDNISLQEVDLQQEDEPDTASRRVEMVPAGVFDIMCGCLFGPLKAEWDVDHYDTKDRKKKASNQLSTVGDGKNRNALCKTGSTTDGTTDEGSTEKSIEKSTEKSSNEEGSKESKEPDDGMPYLGDQDE